MKIQRHAGAKPQRALCARLNDLYFNLWNLESTKECYKQKWLCAMECDFIIEGQAFGQNNKELNQSGQDKGITVQE